jgi:ribonucleoside-diphosphate reductase subunit M2
MTTINTIQKLINNGEKSEEEILDEIRILLNKNNDNKMNEICKWLKIKYGDDNLCGNLPNLKGLNNMISSIESSGISPPWDYLSLGTENKDYSQVYSMFPIVDELAWEFYCMQESQMWSAKELNFLKDLNEFPTLPKRYQQLYEDLLAFFSPGDGLIVKQAIRYLKECTTFSQMAFLISQIFIELVHAEGYGMSITSVITDPNRQKYVFEMVDNLDCVKAKAKFIEKYENSNLSRGLRYIAGAASEGIFFVSLFVVIFYMRSKNIMQTFIFLNEQVSKDETLHRDYNSIQAKILGGFTYEEAVNVLKEALDIEMDHLKYILREPIDSKEADEISGLTLDNIRLFIEGLADQILILAGFQSYFKSNVDLPWMKGLALSRKSNFYEIKVGNYKKISVSEAMDWKSRSSVNNVPKINGVSDPLDVDF